LFFVDLLRGFKDSKIQRFKTYLLDVGRQVQNSKIEVDGFKG
jgi:hypothetical protein